MLLLAVIAGVFGMHALTPGDGSGHWMLPATAMAAGHHDAPGSAEAAPVGPTAAPLPPAFGHGDMAGCILFLVVGGALLLLALALAQPGAAARDLARRAAGLLLDLRRRGPPDGWPRVALSVIRV